MGSAPDYMGYEDKYADEAADEIFSMIVKATALLLGGAVIIRLIRRLRKG